MVSATKQVTVWSWWSLSVPVGVLGAFHWHTARNPPLGLGIFDLFLELLRFFQIRHPFKSQYEGIGASDLILGYTKRGQIRSLGASIHITIGNNPCTINPHTIYAQTKAASEYLNCLKPRVVFPRQIPVFRQQVLLEPWYMVRRTVTNVKCKK